MYPPAEIGFLYKIKKTMLIFYPILLLTVALLYAPPKYLVQAIGLGESLTAMQMADTVAAMREQVGREKEISANLQAQLDACNQRTAPAIGEGTQLPPFAKFDTWEVFQKKNVGKTFSQFNAAKADFYEKQLKTIYKIAK